MLIRIQKKVDYENNFDFYLTTKWNFDNMKILRYQKRAPQRIVESILKFKNWKWMKTINIRSRTDYY
uniref:Uncharacterized protein n=1 Tax=Strigamia maritima TaxID=126957 RepID=T1JBJ5_STRMM